MTMLEVIVTLVYSDRCLSQFGCGGGYSQEGFPRAIELLHVPDPVLGARDMAVSKTDNK